MKVESIKSNKKTLMVHIQETNTLYIRYNVKDDFVKVLNWITVVLKKNKYYSQNGAVTDK